MTLWNLANTGFTARLASKQLSCSPCQQRVRSDPVKGKRGACLRKCTDRKAGGQYAESCYMLCKLFGQEKLDQELCPHC